MSARVFILVTAALGFLTGSGSFRAFAGDLACVPEVASKKDIQSFQALRARGYSESVARRIVVGRPELSKFIQSRAGKFAPRLQGFQKNIGSIRRNRYPTLDEQRDPLTVYRGICAEASGYDPKFKGFHHLFGEPHSMFVSSDRGIAQEYASECSKDGKASVLLELQIPGALMLNAGKWVIGEERVWVVRREHAPDDFTFLTNVEIQTIGQAPRTVGFEDFCQWRRDLKTRGNAASGSIAAEPHAKSQVGR